MHKAGKKIAIEWPTSCMYWHYHQVKKFVNQYGLRKVRFDGCMYGLVSIRPGCQGKKLKKPWTVVTNSIHFPSYLEFVLSLTIMLMSWVRARRGRRGTRMTLQMHCTVHGPQNSQLKPTCRPCPTFTVLFYVLELRPIKGALQRGACNQLRTRKPERETLVSRRCYP